MNTSKINSTFLSTKLNDFIKQMEGDGYTEIYLIEIYKRTNLNFINYCMNKDLEFKDIYIDDFLFDYYGKNSTRYKKRKRAILCFLNFIDNDTYKLKAIFKEKIIINDYYKQINNDFYNYLISSGTKDITAKKKKDINKLFLKWLQNNHINSINLISKDYVYSFFNEINNYSSEYKRKNRETMKIFLNWLNLKKEISFSGNNTIYKVKSETHTTIPSFYTIEEIKKTIEKIERTTMIGKRDYLVFLLLSQYGLRAGDLLNLKFGNFDLLNNKINLIQNKTNLSLSLPLFQEVKYALLDYLKNSRPKSDNDYIFIKYTLNHQQYSNVVIFGNIVTKYLKLANVPINNRHHSSHSLRHSLATNMLCNNTPITAIEGILGHNNISSTEIYLQLDFNKLKDLCLEVPYEL